MRTDKSKGENGKKKKNESKKFFPGLVEWLKW
jgi:hypothetical protein